MRVLINVPNLRGHGGVTALFNTLKMEQYYPNINLFNIYCKFPLLIRIPYKYISFIIKLVNVDLVHINPSLNRKSFLRDAVFAWLTLLFSRKLLIYWHGWEDAYEQKIANNRLLLFIANNSFLKAHTTIVLGTVFEHKLRAMGYKKKIIVETNTAENINVTLREAKQIDAEKQIRILFLSRLEIAKGIYIAINTLKLLNKNYNRFKLIIAGSGSEEENIKKVIANDSAIEWAGYVTGKFKYNLLATSHIMFLPSYTEGLPLTILEGMIHGLPIVSRPVGGIPDIVINKENGFLLDSLEPEAFSQKIISMVENPEAFKIISKNNIAKSVTFSPEKVRDRIYRYYNIMVNDK